LKIQNRDEVEISLQKLVDMDGNSVTEFDDEVIEITKNGHPIDLVFDADNEGTETLNYTDGQFVSAVFATFQIGTNSVNLNEIQDESFAVSTEWIPTGGWDNVEPFKKFIDDTQTQIYRFKITYDINYDLTVTANSGSPSMSAALILRIYDHAVPEDYDYVITEVPLTETGNLTRRIHGISNEYIFSTKAVDPEDPLEFSNLKLALRVYTEGSSGTTLDYDVTVNSINIHEIKQSTFEQTTCKGMLVWEYLLRTCQKITGINDCLRSDFFGRTDGEVWQADADGEGSMYFISSIHQLRGYPIDRYPITGSLRNAFAELNKVWPLELSIEENGESFVVRIEPYGTKASESPTQQLLSVKSGVAWEPDEDMIYGSVKSGYKNYEDDDEGTLNGTHSSRVYSVVELSSKLDAVYNIEMEWIANWELQEVMRRKRFVEDKTKDEDTNREKIIINVKRDGEGYEEVFDDEFSSIEGMSYSGSQGNLEITPARNTLRHASVILSGLKNRIDNDESFDKFLRFESGTANTAVSTTKTGESQIDEDGDLSISQIEDLSIIQNSAYKGTLTSVLTGNERRTIKQNPVIEVIDGVESYECIVKSVRVRSLKTNETELIVVRKE
jgi:hypothetical protein